MSEQITTLPPTALKILDHVTGAHSVLLEFQAKAGRSAEGRHAAILITEIEKFEALARHYASTWTNAAD